MDPLRRLVAVLAIVTLCPWFAGADPAAKEDGLKRLRDAIPGFEDLIASADVQDRQRLLEHLIGRDRRTSEDTSRHEPARIDPTSEEWVALIRALTGKSMPDDTRWLLMHQIARRTEGQRIEDQVTEFLEISLDSPREDLHTMALALVCRRLERKELVTVLRTDLRFPGTRRVTALNCIDRCNVKELVEDVAALLADPDPTADPSATLAALGAGEAAPKIEAALAGGRACRFGDTLFYRHLATGRTPAPVLADLERKWDEKKDGYALDYLGYMEDPAATKILQRICRDWEKSGPKDFQGKPLSKQQILAMLLEAGDASVEQEFLEVMRAAGQGPYGASMIHLNRIHAPKIYGRRCETEYPLESGTLKEHAAALSEWLGVPVVVETDLFPKVGEIRIRTRRVNLALSWICVSTCPIIEEGRIRIVEHWTAVREWVAKARR